MQADSSENDIFVSVMRLQRPRQHDMCLLEARYAVDPKSAGPIKVKETSTALDEDTVPHSAVFRSDHTTAVLLVAQNPFVLTPVYKNLEIDTDLATRIDELMTRLLSCVHGGLYWFDGETLRRVLKHNVPDVSEDLTFTHYEIEPPDYPKIDFCTIVGHASATSGTLGGTDATKIAQLLDELQCVESLVLSCEAGCPGIASGLSEGRTTVGCGLVVDVRASFIFAANFIWKRYGEGTSAAQALGSANVSLPSDPYQIWVNGRIV